MVKEALKGHLFDVVSDFNVFDYEEATTSYFHGERDTLKKLEWRLGFDRQKITSVLDIGDDLRKELERILELEGEEAALERRKVMDGIIDAADLVNAPEELEKRLNVR